jgi:hypothetical protein
MKAKHRHELKTNELAEWIATFPQWAKENLRVIVIASVVVVLAIGSGFFYWYRKNIESARKQFELTELIGRLSGGKTQVFQAQTQGVDISHLLIQIADNLQTFAEDSKDEQMSALALIKRGDALRTELHYRFGAVSEEDAKAVIDVAKTSYTEAVEKSTKNPTLRATAKLGLGLCEEELGNFEGAKQIYTDITEDGAFEGTTALAQAKLRLETMADCQQEVIFSRAPQPPPAETESLQPEEQLDFSDINLPLE